MTRIKSNGFYVGLFFVALLLLNALNFFLVTIPSIPPAIGATWLVASGLILPFLAAFFIKCLFSKTEGRWPEKFETKKVTKISFIILMVLTVLLSIPFLLLSGATLFIFAAENGANGLVGGLVFMLFLLVIFVIWGALLYFAIRLGFTKFGGKSKASKQTVFEQIEGENEEARSSSAFTSGAPETLPASTSEQEWTPISDQNSGFAVREERAPILKWAVSLLALAIVGGGAIWLASKVVIADDVPTLERAEKPAKPEQPQAPKSEDDLAWVKALEIDTVEGYRAYIADFPNGRHVEDARRLINEFDDAAWKLADERDTIAGYEDYLESWPEGLHVTEAKERIAKIKAEEEARRKNAEEAARQEAAAWQAAAQTNTIPSYEGYLSKYPAGKNAPEAQTRIGRLRAEEAARQASAADEAAWQAANATGTADAYQQYLTSYPQGAHVPEAIAKLEELRPGPGKTFKDCAACPTMVSLPAGTAELGAPASDGKAKANEKPARPVTFTNLFAMSVTEVTFDQYGACVSAGGCKSMPSDNGWGQGSRPVINVSWSDAVAYAQWLSNTTGKNYGLPSGAQWEYAARGGKTDALIGGSPAALCAFANGASKESELPWANTACTDLAADRTLPVGSLQKNGFGVADMIGNVSEWVLDCNTLNLRDAPVDGSADARGSCSQRIVRGGSWFSGADDLRYSARLVQRRGDTNDFTGFRVVRN